MHRFLSLFFFSFFFSCVFSQTISPQVIASTGSHFTGANHQLSWTLGEPVISTLVMGNSVLTQGFHQPFNQVFTSVTSVEDVFAVQVFPNPCENILNVLFSKPAVVELNLCDALGKQIFTQPINEMKKAEINLGFLSNGIYLLEIKNTSGQMLQLLKVFKN